MTVQRCLYIYLDESGNFDFSDKGTRFFMLGSVTLERPFGFMTPLDELRLDLLEHGVEIERFHASDDAQSTRDAVFRIIQAHLGGLRIDSTIVEKRKTGPALRAEEHFYPKMLGYHLRHVLEQAGFAKYHRIVIVTDTLPMQRKRRAIEKAVKLTLAAMLPTGANFTVLHHDSRATLALQVADYCTWAIYRKWDRADTRSYELIQASVLSEFDIFRTGTHFYY